MKENELPILYSFVRCPYAMRARYALVKKRINSILREVDLKNKPRELLEISPKGTVPVLLLQDGNVIEESMDIVNFASNKGKIEKGDLEMIRANDREFVRLLKIYKYPDRYPDESKNEALQEIITNFFDKYEDILSKQNFLCGDKMTITDIAIFPFVRQFSKVDLDWFHNSKYIKIIEWLNIFINDADFVNLVMKKHKAWNNQSVTGTLC